MEVLAAEPVGSRGFGDGELTGEDFQDRDSVFRHVLTVAYVETQVSRVRCRLCREPRHLEAHQAKRPVRYRICRVFLVSANSPDRCTKP